MILRFKSNVDYESINDKNDRLNGDHKARNDESNGGPEAGNGIYELLYISR